MNIQIASIIIGFLGTIIGSLVIILLNGIKNSQKDTNKEIKEMNRDIREMLTRLSTNDEKILNAHKRIDEIRDRVTVVEDTIFKI